MWCLIAKMLYSHVGHSKGACSVMLANAGRSLAFEKFLVLLIFYSHISWARSPAHWFTICILYLQYRRRDVLSIPYFMSTIDSSNNDECRILRLAVLSTLSTKWCSTWSFTKWNPVTWTIVGHKFPSSWFCSAGRYNSFHSRTWYPKSLFGLELPL